MDGEMMMKLLCLGGMTLLGGLAIWYKGNANLRGAVAALITEAEYLYRDVTQSGGQKFQWVVDRLYALLPAPVRMVVPMAVVEQIVQRTFDAVADYAKCQLDKMNAAASGNGNLLVDQGNSTEETTEDPMRSRAEGEVQR